MLLLAQLTLHPSGQLRKPLRGSQLRASPTWLPRSLSPASANMREYHRAVWCKRRATPKIPSARALCPIFYTRVTFIFHMSTCSSCGDHKCKQCLHRIKIPHAGLPCHGRVLVPSPLENLLQGISLALGIAPMKERLQKKGGNSIGYCTRQRKCHFTSSTSWQSEGGGKNSFAFSTLSWYFTRMLLGFLPRLLSAAALASADNFCPPSYSAGIA